MEDVGIIDPRPLVHPVFFGRHRCGQNGSVYILLEGSD
jgi:hypothetical protein